MIQRDVKNRNNQQKTHNERNECKIQVEPKQYENKKLETFLNYP